MFTIYDTIQSHIKGFESQLYTAMPGVIERFNAGKTPTVDVRLGVNKLDARGMLFEEGVLYGVPIQYPASRTSGMTFPLEKGDEVLVIFANSDTENWLESRQDSATNPKTLRKHDKNDAFAIPFVSRDKTQVVPDGHERDLIVHHKGSKFVIDSNGHIAVNTDKFSVSNSDGELVDWLHTLTDYLSEVTVNTVYGPSPILNKIQVEELREKINTMKR